MVIVNVFTDIKIMFLVLYAAAVKVVGVVNELYMLSTCQKSNNKAYMLEGQLIDKLYLVLHNTKPLYLHLCLAASLSLWIKKSLVYLSKNVHKTPRYQKSILGR